MINCSTTSGNQFNQFLKVFLNNLILFNCLFGYINIELEEIVMYLQIQSDEWGILQTLLNKNNKQRNGINQLHLIHRQTQLLTEINQLVKSKLNDEEKSINNTNILSVLDRSSCNWLQASYSGPSKLRSKSQADLKSMKKSMIFQRKEINDQNLVSALLQIRQKCSSESYDLIQTTVYRESIDIHAHYQRLIEKQVKNYNDLKSTLIQINQQKQLLKNQLQQCQILIQNHQEQRKKMKKQASDNHNKQNNLLKLETVLLKKQKIHNELKRKIQKKEAQMSQERQIFQQIIVGLEESLQKQQIITENNNHLNQIKSDTHKRKISNTKKSQSLSTNCQKLLNKYYDYYSKYQQESDEDLDYRH